MRRPLGLFLVGCLAISACESSPTDVTPREEGLEGMGLVASAQLAEAGAEGFLVNVGMETDEGWWFRGPDGTSQEYSAEDACSGDRSIRLSHPAVTGVGDFSFAGQYTTVQDPSEQTYSLTVRMKLENVSGQGVAIAVRGDKETAPAGWAEAFATTQGKQTLVGTTDWMDVTVELSGLESDIQSIAVYLILLSETSGTVYFDDVEFSSSDWTPIRTLLNGGFETGGALPNHWWRGGRDYRGFYFQWDGVESWEGNKAVSISRPNPADSAFAFWAQTLFAEDFWGGSATLKAQVKTALDGQGVSIVIRGDDTYQPSGHSEVFATTEGVVSITGDQDWTEYAVTLDYVPSTTKSLTVYLVYLPETTGRVLFDGVSLSR